MGLEDVQETVKANRGLVAVHSELLQGGWDTLRRIVEAERQRLDRSKQTLLGLPFYNLIKMKKKELVQVCQQEGIVLPIRASKEEMAWLVIQKKVQLNQDDQGAYASEIARLTCSTCRQRYFEDGSEKGWVRCSVRGCFQWNHLECENFTAEAAKRQKKLCCRKCTANGGRPDEEEDPETRDLFFEDDRKGPPRVGAENLGSEHHVVDGMRGGRLVQLGSRVFPDDEFDAN